MKRNLIRAILFAIAIVIALGAFISLEKRVENGYVAFNAADYSLAQDELKLPAKLYSKSARQLMAYMAGLGLGQAVNLIEAKELMMRIDRNSFAQQAYYLGKDAYKGQYGSEKVSLGKDWLKIAAESGSSEAQQLLNTKP